MKDAQFVVKSEAKENMTEESSTEPVTDITESEVSEATDLTVNTADSSLSVLVSVTFVSVRGSLTVVVLTLTTDSVDVSIPLRNCPNREQGVLLSVH